LNTWFQVLSPCLTKMMRLVTTSPTGTPFPRALGQPFFSRLSAMCAIPRAYSLDLKSIRRARGDATAATVRATYAAMTVKI